MADGTIVAPSGDTIWTEDVGNVKGKLERVKLALGPVDTDSGDVSITNPIPTTYQVSSFTNFSVVVGLTGAQIHSSSIPAKLGVQVRAKGGTSGNAGTIYIGGPVSESSVTAATNAATDGMPLYAGDSEFIPCTDVNQIFAIADMASQVLFVTVF